MTFVSPLFALVIFAIYGFGGVIVGVLLSVIAPILDIKHLDPITPRRFALAGLILAIIYQVVIEEFSIGPSFGGVDVGAQVTLAALFTAFGWRLVGKTEAISVYSIESARSVGFTLFGLELIHFGLYSIFL